MRAYVCLSFREPSWHSGCRPPQGRRLAWQICHPWGRWMLTLPTWIKHWWPVRRGGVSMPATDRHHRALYAGLYLFLSHSLSLWAHGPLQHSADKDMSCSPAGCCCESQTRIIHSQPAVCCRITFQRKLYATATVILFQCVRDLELFDLQGIINRLLLSSFQNYL